MNFEDNTMTIKKYTISHMDSNFSAEILIDEEKAKDAIQSTVEFWSGWEEDLDYCDGDYTQCFLRKLGIQLTILSLHYGFNKVGMIEYMRKEEGWAYLDGSYGITLQDVEIAYISIDDIWIEEGKK